MPTSTRIQRSARNDGPCARESSAIWPEVLAFLDAQKNASPDAPCLTCSDADHASRRSGVRFKVCVDKRELPNNLTSELETLCGMYGYDRVKLWRVRQKPRGLANLSDPVLWPAVQPALQEIAWQLDFAFRLLCESQRRPIALLRRAPG